MSCRWKNSPSHYGGISKCLHWLVAVTVFGLFGLGVWMVELDYYHRWYQRGPDLHRSIGVLLIAVTLLRGGWLLYAGKPSSLPGHRTWEVAFSRLTHRLLYLIVFVLGLSGYLITTADGRPMAVFTWFVIPSSGEWLNNQEDIAGEIHQWLAYGLIALVATHAIGAIKHHFLDRDDTLKRML